MKTPGFTHSLIAFVLQSLIAIPIAFITHDGVMAFSIGGFFALGFYIGRERRQAEEVHMSNAIPPWVFLPRSVRDVFWPALTVTLSTLLVWVVFRILM